MRLLLHRRPRGIRAALLVVGLLLAGGTSALAVYAAVVVRNRDRLAISPTPLSRRIAPGAATTFRIRIRRQTWVGAVKVRVSSRLPPGITTSIGGPTGGRRPCAGASGPRRSFVHRACWYRLSARQSRVTLRVRTSPRTRVGVYRLRVRGVRYGGGTTNTTSVFLVIKKPAPGSPTVVDGASDGGAIAPPETPEATAPVTPVSGASAPAPVPAGEPFPIRGDVTGLYPGRTLPLDLEVSNDRPNDRLITALGVGLGELTVPSADVGHPCSAVDFAVTQMPADAFPIVLPSGTHRLSELGVPVGQRPQVSMVDRPVNQDGCRLATQKLTFTGTAGEAP